MKKLVLALLLATVIAGGTFAQISLSAGLGGTFTANFINVTWTQAGKDAMSNVHLDRYDMNIIGGGFFAYFDATYVMVSLGMGFYDISPAGSTTKTMFETYKWKWSLTTFDFGLLGKYPIPLGRLTLFPLMGADFKIALSQDWTVGGTKYTYAEYPYNEGAVGEYWTSIWFKFGVGADIPLGGKFYLRPMFLYGFGTVPKFFLSSSNPWEVPQAKDGKLIYHGFDIKVAAGYKF